MRESALRATDGAGKRRAPRPCQPRRVCPGEGSLPEQMRNVLVAGAVLGGFDPPALLSAVAGSVAETAARALQRGIDVGRSRLLHRLRLLGVDWGIWAPTRSGTGTFTTTTFSNPTNALTIDLGGGNDTLTVSSAAPPNDFTAGLTVDG